MCIFGIIVLLAIVILSVVQREGLDLARPHKIIYGNVHVDKNTITSDSESENLPEDYKMEEDLYKYMRSVTPY
jgi:hypothetical protein